MLKPDVWTRGRSVEDGARRYCKGLRAIAFNQTVTSLIARRPRIGRWKVTTNGSGPEPRVDVERVERSDLERPGGQRFGAGARVSGAQPRPGPFSADGGQATGGFNLPPR
jgi:hypothetical protein